MHHRLRLKISERGLDPLAFGQIALDKRGPRIDRAAMPFGKIVEDADFVVFVEQELGANAPDIAGSANDENLHRGSWRVRRRAVKTKRALRSLTFIRFQRSDHPPDDAILSSRREDLEPLLFRSPFQNIDVDVAHAPGAHCGPAAFV